MFYIWLLHIINVCLYENNNINNINNIYIYIYIYIYIDLSHVY